MKHKLIAATVIMAMAIGLCSCKEQPLSTSTDNSSGVNWSGTNSENSGFRPTKPISGDSSSDGSAASVPYIDESSDNNSSEVPVDKPVKPVESEVIPDFPSEEYPRIAVASGESFVVESGMTVALTEGTSEIDEGGQIYVKGGGELLVYGDINLNGNLILDGEMALSENASISGSGRVVVSESFEQIKCDGHITAEIVPPSPVEIDGVTYVGGVLVANKKHSLPEDYGNGLTDELWNALEEMRCETGYSFLVMSGFRSYETQKNLFWSYVEADGYDNAVTYSAYPGTSEHQTGLAADLGWVDEQYAYTEEGMWLAENCHEYGFIIRYPKDKDNITGYIYEPWHVRYLGRSTAKLVHDSGLTLEEFLRVEG